MKKALLSLAVFASFVGAVSVAACVGDSDSTVPATTTPDAATTPPTPSTIPTTAPTTAPGDDDDAGKTSPPDGGADAGGGRACMFTTTQFPCAAEMTPTCYADSPSCALTACAGTGLSWTCNSPNQCENGPCCIPSGTATFAPGTVIAPGNCVAGPLLISADAGAAGGGSYCSQTSATTCDPGTLQMCQLDTQCPAKQHCAPATVGGGAPGSMKGQTLGLCTPN